MGERGARMYHGGAGLRPEGHVGGTVDASSGRLGDVELGTLDRLYANGEQALGIELDGRGRLDHDARIAA